MSSTSASQYTVGGALRQDAPTYISRQADEDLFQALMAREYCHIFNARQMGKSSLRVQTTQRLKAKGIACGIIEVSAIVEHGMTSEAWYLGIIRRLSRSLGIKLKVIPWWQERDRISPIQRFSEFIEDVLLKEIQQPIVIFIDEIDSLFQFGFSDDFFSLIRYFYQERAEHPNYRRLTFTLIGVATPSELISARDRTPFNIGTAIQLRGFTLDEAKPLSAGLAHLSDYGEGVIQSILRWTGGQPFLTQKLCQLIVSEADIKPQDYPGPYVDQLVERKIIQDWLQQDTPEHLKTIQDRLLHSSRAQRLLEVYRDILKARIILMDDSPEQNELQLTGLVVKEGAYLKIANQIYVEIFRPWWIDRRLSSLCPYQAMLDKWLTSNCDAKWLLDEQSLQAARAWAGNQSLREAHHQFLMNSQSHIYEQEMARQEAIRKREQEKMRAEVNAISARKETKLKQLFTTSIILFTLSGLMLITSLLVLFRRTTSVPKPSEESLHRTMGFVHQPNLYRS
ncbi:AAA-like domain-containing protein [Leptothoe sp. PORK10 BA2]|uniref:AAA-like domain-containing protein n=1 Tax=Leptothoe sp. PORK10 BA2 TaxID=3110254 RepID=UPI002B1F2285|nr:AAA-like domain-containing protein [Leptothoe sp. PORK10 BA2]MEA5462526.1 AAA-like domain-containing protein [Leptothoe sp. PORK10 BA2]